MSKGRDCPSVNECGTVISSLREAIPLSRRRVAAKGRLKLSFAITLVLAGRAGVLPVVCAADVSLYSVGKVHHFFQATAGVPATPVTNGYSFQATVIAAGSNLVTGAEVRSLAIGTKALEDRGGGVWGFEERFNSQQALDSSYPHSTLSAVHYWMNMQTTNDGIRDQLLSYSAFLGGYPITPRIQNWGAAQEIDHTLSFLLQWSPLGGSTSDVVQVLIEAEGDAVLFATPTPPGEGALNSSSNSVVVPSYTLPPGTNLTGHLLVAHVAGLPNTNYSFGAPVLAKEVTFPMTTRPAPTPPLLSILPGASQQAEILLMSDSNRTYRIEFTEDGSAWEELLVTNSTTGAVQYSDPESGERPFRLYRALVGE